MLCAVYGCNNCNNKSYKLRREDVSYFHFPKDPELLKIWINFCKRKDAINTKTGRICSDHFTPDDMERNLQFEMGFMSKKRLRLKPGSAPSVYKATYKDDTSGRKSRIVAREKKQMIKNLLIESTNETDTDDENEEECLETSPENGTDPIDISGCRNCVLLKIEMDVLHLKMKTMEERCKRIILSESVLLEKIKSLELELEQGKLRNTDNVKKCVTISSDEQIQKISSTEVKQQRRPKVDIDKSKNFYSAKLELEQSKSQITNNLKECVPISSDEQIQRISSTEVKQQRWSKADIDNSKNFYSANSKAYKIMRKRGVLLPSERTLQRWAKKKSCMSWNFTT